MKKFNRSYRKLVVWACSGSNTRFLVFFCIYALLWLACIVGAIAVLVWTYKSITAWSGI